MKCKFCAINEADKTNTHYLTDSIIRSALNEEGSQKRAKGYYFDLSSNKDDIKVNFQQGTNIETLENDIGRKVTEDEIEKAKVIPHSVDYFFCTSCEKLFTSIETRFITKILPKFRKADLNGKIRLYDSEVVLIRLFFYLQICRTSICKNEFNLSKRVQKRLIEMIQNYDEMTIEDVNIFPISISYLQTCGSQKNYSQNIVGYTSSWGPKVIFMNDFLIQFFETKENIKFVELYGINMPLSFHKNINHLETNFLFGIISDSARKQFLTKFMIKHKFEPKIEEARNNFKLSFLHKFGVCPTEKEASIFISKMVSRNVNVVIKYTNESIEKFTADYIKLL